MIECKSVTVVIENHKSSLFLALTVVNIVRPSALH